MSRIRTTATISGQEQKDPLPVLFSKTCQNCFSLKIRCDRTQESDICDRCAGLHKTCKLRAARRRDNSAKRDSRIQTLERQVKDLLTTQHATPTPQRALSKGSAMPSISSEASFNHDTVPTGDVIDEFIVSIERAETLLQMYRSDMMPHFPFVIIQSHITARDLRYSKPFMFLAILLVASSHDLPVQDQLGNRFKALVSNKVLFRGDDSLSLEYLQGLLIVLAWNQYHGQSKYYSQYLQLAISIAVDMRLDRKPIQLKPKNSENKRDPISGIPGGIEWGSEEQRSAAGIFYLSSTISKLFDKMNTFACTKSIADGCLALMQRGECPTDQHLCHVIHLQRIIENIEKLVDPGHSDAEAQDTYLHTRVELEKFRSYLTSDVSSNHLLYMQFYTAQLFLFQVIFFERSLQQDPSLHLKILCEGLEATKSCLDLYLWLPPKSEMHLTNSQWIQLNFAITLAAKFAIVSRDWSVEAQTRDLRHNLNIEHIFRHFVLRIGALVDRTSERTKSQNIFAYYEQRVKRVEHWYQCMVQASIGSSPARQPANHSQDHRAKGQHRSHYHKQDAIQTPSAASPELLYRTTPTVTLTSLEPLTHSGDSNTGYSFEVGVSSTGAYPYANDQGSEIAVSHLDLLNAPGWECPFAMPMEDAWTFDLAEVDKHMPPNAHWVHQADI